MNTIPKEDSISSFLVAENDFGEEGDILDEDFRPFTYFWTISGLILDHNRSRLDSIGWVLAQSALKQSKMTPIKPLLRENGQFETYITI